MPLPWSIKPIDRTGQRFSNWTVIRRLPKSKWECRCDCGTVRVVLGSTLTRGTSQRCAKCMGRRMRKHGMDGTSTYLIWAKMKHRCLNPGAAGYVNYGARGITVCERWNDFRNFLADMGERPTVNHSIDRIDNDKGYEPGNCRWATRKQQQRNRRNTAFVVWNGERRPLGDVAEECGTPLKLVRNRLAVGWSIEKALTIPSRKI
jgi:hypothetical protein